MLNKLSIILHKFIHYTIETIFYNCIIKFQNKSNSDQS